MVKDKHLKHQPFKIKALYTQSDISSLKFVNSLPGQPPFVRGPHADMYNTKSWTIRQYTGFASAEESNKSFHKTLEEGGQGLSVAFDLPTHLGYDSDHPAASADVGMAGVAIDSVEDMKTLFQDIDLSSVSVSMTMNGAVLPIMAAFIVAAEESGVKKAQLRGTIQNDILKEFLVRNTYIFEPKVSLHSSIELVSYLTDKLPLFNSMSISGYHFQEAGADPCLELALTIANARLYLDRLSQKGISLDKFCRRLSFFFGIGMQFYQEIAKLRAARYLWNEEMDKRGVTDETSKKLRMHCQTSGWSLSAQEPMNNIIRTTIEAMGAVFGGTQSLHTNAYDEALSIPSDESARVARNTQLILQQESGIGDVVDPWAGSFMMESLTDQMIQKVHSYLNQIDQLGGIIEAIEQGWITDTIHQLAIQKQTKIDNATDVIIGVNKFQVQNNSEVTPQARKINNDKVKQRQLEQLSILKASRNQVVVNDKLKQLTSAASQFKDNLMDCTVEAIRARATIGEVTQALNVAWPRAKMDAAFSSQQSNMEHKNQLDWERVKRKVHQYTKHNNRPKILIAKLGLDGHDRGAKVVAAGLQDLGFDVTLSNLFQTAEDIAHSVTKIQPDILGISLLSGAHLKLVKELNQQLANTNIIKIVGGIIPKEHHLLLRKQGIDQIFTPGSRIDDIASRLIDLLHQTKQTIPFHNII